MKKRLITFLGLIGCLTLAVAQDGKQNSTVNASDTQPASATVAAKGADEYPVIGYLEKRDCVITIKSSPHGTIYSVADKQGKILHENVSAEQLKAQAPEVYELIKTGTGNDARLQAISIR